MKVSEFTIKHLSRIINGDCDYTPYLTGSMLVELFNRYGFRDTYGQGFPSRWLYVEEKIKKLNGSVKLAKVIEEIVDPRSYYDTEFKVAEAVDKINNIISYDGYLLIEKGKRYKIVNTESVYIEPESLGEIENDFLTEQIKKCDDKILEEDFDGAITNARTLVETVIVDILSKYDLDYQHKGDLIAAYQRIKRLLNLDPSNIDYPDSIKQILSGLISIINGLANMRNEMSDAHTRRYKPERHHAKLAVNSSKTLSEFLIDTLIKQYRKER
jgi:hypothetical protein